MKPILPCVILSIHALTLGMPAAGVKSTPTLPSKVDAIVAKEMATRNLMGVSVAVIDHGKLVVTKGYGLREAATGTPVDVDSMFAIGSVSKQFTCAAILLLAEEGKLSVDDTVSKYFPDLTRAEDITLLDLMHHVSGYPDYYPLDFVDERMQRAIDPDDLIKRYAGGRLDFPPRSNYSYSNTGYIILGRIVEKTSGIELGEFLKRRIFEPLAMHHTVFDPGPAVDNIAKGYRSFALAEREEAAPEGHGWLGGAGAIRSTAGDLARWDLALADGALLKPDSWRIMTSPIQLTDGRTSEYACGMWVSHRNGFLAMDHSGAVSGFMAGNTLVPATRSAVVVLSNCEQPIGDLRNALFEALTQKSMPIPEIKGKSAVDAATELLHQFQSGRLERGHFGDDFNQFVTPERAARASVTLKKLGSIKHSQLMDRGERGGMEVATVRFELKRGTCKALMYRSTDGQIQEFLILP